MYNEKTVDYLYKLKKEILRSNNDDLVSQINHAIHKSYYDQLSFSFIGHFSAGKSSLINHLLNRDLLPSSPIPTTSNTVSIEIAESEDIKAYINQYQYVTLHSEEELREINATDVDIQSIVMRVKNNTFKPKTIIQDTPGVDSNVIHHQASTERFLLNSDYIFFTVEYNHVESESNLKLLKEISELNIPFSLIINQVDKHDDEEITFDTFLNRIKDTLEYWGIAPQNIFTTTIYDSPYNQVEEVLTLIHSIESDKATWQEKYHHRIINNIEKKQLDYLAAEIETYTNEDDAKFLTTKTLETRIENVKKEVHDNRMEALLNDEEALNTYIKMNVKDIVKNAYIFNHEIKESIHHFLKHLSNDIKVGGLFGKKEKLQRSYNDAITQINESLEKTFKSTIDAPVNEMFINIGLSGQSFNYDWSDNLLNTDKITSLTSAYVLNYLDQLKSAIEKDAVNQVLAFKEQLNKKEVKSNGDSNYSQELENLETTLKLLKLKEAIETKQYRHLHIHIKDEIDKLQLVEEVENNFNTLETTPPSNALISDKREESMSIDTFENVVSILENNQRYDKYTQIFKEKLKRMKSGKVNISVFGGFSAGKTSFINALMGKHYLTTSPNPTTATITEVTNGTSSASFKTAEELSDLLMSVTGETLTLEDYSEWITKNKSKVSEINKPFINGFIEKYQTYKDILGKTVTFDTDELSQMIANDSDSVFLHKAKVAIHNDFTETFNVTDSPGINSTNKRHTNETRDIISSSDLIIYVSYYNHVFTKSDEQFLKYIQSIKGNDFPMTVIINAIDLMKSESDLEKVVQYMGKTLNQMSVAHDIYPVSSKRAIHSPDEYFKKAQKHIETHAKEHSHTLQLSSLELLLEQLKERIKSDIRMYDDQTIEIERIQHERNSIIESLQKDYNTPILERLSQELDIILNFIEKQLELNIYDHLKAVLHMGSMSDKSYIEKNLSDIEQNLMTMIHMQVSTSMNAVYRKADKEKKYVIDELNKHMISANITHQIETHKISVYDSEVSLDLQKLQEYEKELYQKRNNSKLFREKLLELSQSLATSLDKDKLYKDMMESLKHFVDEYDERTENDIKTVMGELNQDIETISESDYHNNKMLIKQLNEVT